MVAELTPQYQRQASLLEVAAVLRKTSEDPEGRKNHEVGKRLHSNRNCRFLSRLGHSLFFDSGVERSSSPDSGIEADSSTDDPSRQDPAAIAGLGRQDNQFCSRSCRRRRWQAEEERQGANYCSAYMPPRTSDTSKRSYHVTCTFMNMINCCI